MGRPIDNVRPFGRRGSLARDGAEEARRLWSENIYTPAKRRMTAAEADVQLMEQRLEAAKQALADAKAEVKAAAATLADAEQAEPK